MYIYLGTYSLTLDRKWNSPNERAGDFNPCDETIAARNNYPNPMPLSRSSVSINHTLLCSVAIASASHSRFLF